MTCTRTGAHIWLEPYGEWLYGDAFEISPWVGTDLEHGRAAVLLRNAGLTHTVTPVAYFNIAARSFRPINGLSVRHYTIRNYDYWSHQGDVEQALVNSMMISNNFVNHGYYGVPIDAPQET